MDAAHQQLEGRPQSVRHTLRGQNTMGFIYNSPSDKRLHRYLDEFTGRHNQRGQNTLEQISRTFKGMEGKRLKYEDLIKA